MFAFRYLRWLPSRRALCSLVTLVGYVCATMGMPMGNWGHPTIGCRCGEELKAAGLCCCSKKMKALESALSCCSEGQAAKSCCVAKKAIPTETTLKPCCAARTPTETQSSCCQKPADNAPSQCPQVSACGCGGEPIGEMWCNSDPRVLPSAVLVEWVPSLEERAWEPLLAFSSRRDSPETPPPKVPAANGSVVA